MDRELCARCQQRISDRTPREGTTQQAVLTKTVVTWRLRLRRFHWRWLPDDPLDRVEPFSTTLGLCDWCAGDVFLFAQGLPPRSAPKRRLAATNDHADPK